MQRPSFNSRLYKWWWYFLGGRKEYRLAHGHDWHRETRLYPWWEAPFRKNARKRKWFSW